MGINSTEVAYNFGQLGSAFQNNATAPIFPPKDHVIVAIQFMLANTVPAGGLVSETLDTGGPQFPSTSTAEATSSNYLGVTEAACDAAGSTVGVVVLTATNAKIKKGQYIIIGLDNDAIDDGIELDTSAGHVDPIYNGPNKQGFIVKDIDGTSLTISNANGTVFNASNLDNANTLYFLDEYHGAGGTNLVSQSVPAGTTMYGRWTKFTGDGNPVICYFGK